jgi:hypothetical protein
MQILNDDDPTLTLFKFKNMITKVMKDHEKSEIFPCF